jgi:hypothetical protein
MSVGGFKARWLHIKSIGKPWWLVVGAAWGVFWTADEVIAKYGSQHVKEVWDKYTLHFPFDWKIGLIGFLAIFLALLMEGSFRHHHKINEDHAAELEKRDAEITRLRVGLLKPVVVPHSYGRKTIGRHGLFVVNDSYAAYDLVAHNVDIGLGAKLTFTSGKIDRLSDKDEPQLFEAWIEYEDGRTGTDGEQLHTEMVHCGKPSLDVPVTYKDGDLNEWKAICRISLEPEKPNGLSVSLVTRYLLAKKVAS